MTATTAPVSHADRFFIGGEWVQPSSDATIDVIDSGTEELYYTIAAAAPTTCREPSPPRARRSTKGRGHDCPRRARRLPPRARRRDSLEHNDVLAQLWPRQSGALYASRSTPVGSARAPSSRTPRSPTRSRSKRSAHRPAAASSACWCASRSASSARSSRGTRRSALICHKIGPALLAGCTIVLKSSPEAPGEALRGGRGRGTDRPAAGRAQRLDRRPRGVRAAGPRSRVDKITFTGRRPPGRRIASICGERIARCTLELGGKSAAVILDDMDLAVAAKTLARAECAITGQVCSSLTRSS